MQYANPGSNLDDISVRTVTINAGGATINTNNNSTITFANGIGNGGAGGFTLAGGGTLVFSGSNSYQGTTTVANGTLVLNNAGAFPQNTPLAFGDATNNSSKLDLNGHSITITGISSTGNGPSNIESDNSVNVLLTYAGASPGLYFGSINDGGSGQVALTVSSNTLTLANNNGYTGPTNISSGATLAMGSANGNDGNLSPSTTVTDNGTLKFNATDAGAVFFASTVNGPGNVVQAGTNQVFLQATNSYSGTTEIDSGILEVDTLAANGTPQPLGTASTAILLGSATAAGTLQYGGPTAALNRPVTVNGVGGGIINNTGGGILTLAATLTKNGNNLTLSGGTFLVNGQITGPSVNSDLIIGNNATVTLNNASNNYNGATRVNNGGTLINGLTNALPTTTTVVLGEASGNTNGTYDMNAFNQTVGGLSNLGTGSAIVTNNGSSASTSTLTVAGGTSSFGGTIQNGTSGGKVALGVSSGSFTLTGSNSYSGGTSVTGGTLSVGSVNALGTGGLSIGASATAALTTGTAAGPVVLPSVSINGNATPHGTLDITNSKMVLTNTSYASAVSAYTVARRKSPMPWMALPGINPASPAPRWPTTLIIWGCPPAWR